jgi:DNA modification methylase
MPPVRQVGLPVNRVVCGDNVDVMSKWQKRCIDLVVTSPPYDNLRTYGGHSWDFECVARELFRILKVGGVIVWVVADATVDGSETGTSFRQALHFMGLGMRLHDTMIWEKTGSGAIGSQLCYAQNYEFCFVVSKGTPKSVNLIKDRPNVNKSGWVNVNGGIGKNGKAASTRLVRRNAFGKRSNIWTIDPQRNSSHPAPFPLELARDHVVSWSSPEDFVLDPFCGSGTTGVACAHLGRKFIGIDINEKYCDDADTRIKAAYLQAAAKSRKS